VLCRCSRSVATGTGHIHQKEAGARVARVCDELHRLCASFLSSSLTLLQFVEMWAASAVVDAASNTYLIIATLQEDGTLLRVVDINSKSLSFASIIANCSLPYGLLGGFHVLDAPDDSNTLFRDDD